MIHVNAKPECHSGKSCKTVALARDLICTTFSRIRCATLKFYVREKSLFSEIDQCCPIFIQFGARPQHPPRLASVRFLLLRCFYFILWIDFVTTTLDVTTIFCYGKVLRNFHKSPGMVMFHFHSFATSL